MNLTGFQGLEWRLRSLADHAPYKESSLGNALRDLSWFSVHDPVDAKVHRMKLQSWLPVWHSINDTTPRHQ